MRPPLGIIDDAERPKGKNQKTDDEILNEEIYKRRVKLVAYAHTDYFKFKQYLLDNESFFKSKMNDADKECMRRTCQTAWNNSRHSEVEDVDIFNRIFGRLIDPRVSETIPLSEKYEPKEKPMTIEEEIEYRSRGSYHAMWEFISNPKWQEQLKGRTDLYDKVKYMIDRAKENNESVLPGRFKLYEPSDEEMYAKVLGLMNGE